jgi:hypothetical protein
VHPVSRFPDTLDAPWLQFASVQLSAQFGYPENPAMHSLQSVPSNGAAQVSQVGPLHLLRQVHVHDPANPETAAECPLQSLLSHGR